MLLMQFTIILVLSNTPVNSQIKEYNPDVAIDMNEPEKPYEWDYSVALLPEFKAFTEGARYMGLLIAGQAEFPWIMDIRILDTDQERWATGNLINSYWILTACHFLQGHPQVGQCAFTEKQDLMVLFCSNYLYEDYSRYNESSQVVFRLIKGSDSSGIRIVERFVRHPKYECESREYDVLLVKLQKGINPYPPVIGFMPFFGGPQERRLNLPPVLKPLQSQKTTNMLCYVASFGRTYYNFESPQSLNYKVRYRAYYSEWSYCASNGIPNHLCANDGEQTDGNCVKQFEINKPDTRQFMCFRTYSSHGAVCEHDRGAPLVCDGQVYGYVVRGVEFHRCSNRRPFPFVVSKLGILNGSIFSVDESQFSIA